MALKKNSPFKSRKEKPKPIAPSSLLPNDMGNLELRKEQRQRLDLESVSLEMCYDTHTKFRPVFKRDFAEYVQRFPHHEELIKQLLSGVARSTIGRQKSAFQSYQGAALAIENFIEFLNGDEPLTRNVFCVADITFITAKMFHSWLLRTAPGRTTNRKFFANIRGAVLALQKDHSEHPRIGKAFSWPPGPRQNEKVSESYPRAIFNRLVDCCLTDINSVIPRMSEFHGLVRSTPPFMDGDGVKPRWPGSADDKTKSKLSFEQTERMAFATAHHLYPNWPLGMKLAQATETLSLLASRTKSRTLAEERARLVIQSCRFGPEGAPMAIGQMSYFSHFAFSGNTLYPFFLFVQLNTGWNQESVMALTDCLDDHIEQDLVDEHYCIIYSTKQRTQKAVSHRSNMKSPLSVYRILRFVEAQVTKHKSSPYYIPGSLWQFIQIKNLWPKHQKMLAALDLPNISNLSRGFLKRHEIDLGLSSKYASIEARRIRTTHQTRRREQGLSTEAMTDLMGHEDIDTTAQYYDSDSGSNELKNRHIRDLQNIHLDDFKNYRARLVHSTTLKDLREAVSRSPSKMAYEIAASKLGNATPAEVVHLLSPQGQTYIAACTNSNAPSWKDAGKFVSPEDKCRFFNRCCMCDKAIIFREALPWVVRRIADLETLRLRIPAPDWTLNYAEELSGWEWILTNWSNPAEITEAQHLATSDLYRLPLTMMGA